jgi:hypothetical protein
MKNSDIASYVAGVGSTEDIDSSGEVIEIKGIDYSSLCRDGRIKWEHLGDNASQIIGKIVDCKRIMKESDCEHELHRRYWEKARKKPYLYVVGALFDKVGHSAAKDAVAHLNFDKIIDHEKTKNLGNWSIEGSRLNKDGNRIKKCIARDFAFTNRECNKACYAELLTDEEANNHVPSIGKNKIEESMKKSLQEETDLTKTEPRKYYKELSTAKKPEKPSYSKITTATGEHREGKPFQPEREYASSTPPSDWKVGDRTVSDKKQPKTGKAFYRDLYKDLGSPIREAIVKKEIKTHKAESGKPKNLPVSEHYPQSVKNKSNESKENTSSSNVSIHENSLKQPKEKELSNVKKINKKEILKSLANEAWDNFKHKDLLIESIKKTEPELEDNEILGIAKTYAYIDMKKKESEIEDMFEKDEDEDRYKALLERRKKTDGPGSRSNQHHREKVASGKKSQWEEQYKPKTGPQKGVHLKARGLSSEKHGGTSEAGSYVKRNKAKARDYDFNPEPRKVQIEEAKKQHKKVISEQKQMPKPNLPKSEDLNKARVDEGKSPAMKQVARAYRNKRLKTKKPDGSYKITGTPKEIEKAESLYHIHQGGTKITSQPITLKEIHEKHGGAKKLESNGFKVVPHQSENKDIKKSKDGRCWDGYEPTPGKKPYDKGSCQPVKKEEKPFHGYNKKKHSKEGGLNDKERERINREEGSNLKRPVTGKVKAGSDAAKRKKSFCARMSGNEGATSKDGKLTPKGAALKRWKCNKNEEND